MPPESTITAAIIAMLKAIPYSYVLKFHGSEYQQAGVPDILFWKAHEYTDQPECLAFAFEVKTARGRVSPIQAVQLDRMMRACVICSVVRSVDEVRAILVSNGISGERE